MFCVLKSIGTSCICNSSPVSVTKSFESMEAWCMLCYNAAVFAVFAVLTLSSTRGKCRIEGRHLIALGTQKAVNCMRRSRVQLLPALRIPLISNTTAYHAITYMYSLKVVDCYVYCRTFNASYKLPC